MLLLLNVTRRTHTHTHDSVHVSLSVCVGVHFPVCVCVCVQFVGCLPCSFPIGNCWKIKVICIYLQNRAARATAATMPACLPPPYSTLSLQLDTPRHDVVGVSSCISVCVGMWKITRFIAYDCRYNLLICRTIFATSLPCSLCSLYSFLFPLFVLARNFNVNIEYKSD